MQQIGPQISSFGVENHGIRAASIVRWNFTTPALYEYAIRANEAMLANGPLVVRTGDHTGRSPNDKFVVREPRATTPAVHRTTSSWCVSRAARKRCGGAT